MPYKPKKSFLVQALDQAPDGVQTAKVFRDDLLGGDADLKGIVDLGDQRYDIQGIQNAVTDQILLRFKIHVGMHLLQNLQQLLHDFAILLHQNP